MLTNIPKISPNTRGDIFQINFPQNDQKHDKSALMEISEVFGTLSHVHSQTCSETALFREWSNQDFQSLISEVV